MNHSEKVQKIESRGLGVADTEGDSRGALDKTVPKKRGCIWDDVAGLKDVKESLWETVILPSKSGMPWPFRSILLYGAPGSGKSYLAKAIAAESDAEFLPVSATELVSKWHGETERLVRSLFEKARESNGGRSIVFVDDIDFLCESRSGRSCNCVRAEFLVQMDIMRGTDGILVLGATSVPWFLDADVRDCMDKRIYLPLPDKEARTNIVRSQLRDTPNKLTEEDLHTLGHMTDGGSASDLLILVKNALMEPLRRCQKSTLFLPVGDCLSPCTVYPNCPLCPPMLSSDPNSKKSTCGNCHVVRMDLWDVPPEKLKVPEVTMGDFERVLEHSPTSVSPDELARFNDWTMQFG